MPEKRSDSERIRSRGRERGMYFRGIVILCLTSRENVENNCLGVVQGVVDIVEVGEDPERSSGLDNHPTTFAG